MPSDGGEETPKIYFFRLMIVYPHRRNFDTLLSLYSSVNLYVSMPDAHHPRQHVMVNEAEIGVYHGLVESM